MSEKELYTLWELVFYRADNPPDDEMEVICTDGQTIGFGYHDSSLDQPWRHISPYCETNSSTPPYPGSPWPSVKAWAEPPDPEECMMDCYLETRGK